MQSNVPFTEPIAVPDVFVSGVGRVDPIGDGIFRITYYVDHHSAFDGRSEKVVVARMLISGEAINRAIETVTHATTAPIHVAANS